MHANQFRASTQVDETTFVKFLIPELIATMDEFPKIYSSFIIAMVVSSTMAFSVPEMQVEQNTRELAKNMSKFYADLYHDIAESSKGNIVISPFSISSAVAFLSQGANGTTFEQIANALHLPNDKKVVADLFHEFSNQFEKSEETSKLTVANRIFVTNRYKINSTFNDIAESKFHAGAETVDFLQNVETANKINGWVEQKTNEKIKDLVKANDLKPETGLVLANAIYFSGAWANEFDETDTKPGKFHLNSNDKTDVEYMHLTEYFGYVELADLDAVACKFPYNDGRMSMIVILPNQITGLAELELKMKDYDMSRIFDEMHRVKVDVTLPKFKFEFESNLNDTLQKLGMSEMFDESKADLSGLLETAKRLKVSQVVHKAFIDVNEKGTEAAAATYARVDILMASPSMREIKIYKFTVDHPFLFSIYQNNIPLFTGRVNQL